MATIVCNEEETHVPGPWHSRQDRAASDSDTAKYPTAEEHAGMREEHARLRDELGGLREEHTRLREERGKVVEELARLREELEPQKQAHRKEKLPNELVRPGKEIIGESAALRAVLKKVETVAPTNSTVLIQGETGTGKELIALALHRLSQRSNRPLAKINCAAIPSALLESELFGHEKGAFTGAHARKMGRFEMADQGTLFLDEVADIPLEIQPKLLRVLQEKEFERVGGLQSHRVNVRLVAATSRDLSQMVGEQQFRGDLYYRLNVFPIRVPSLRERSEDIPALVQHFVEKYARQMNKRIETTPSHVMDSLKNYGWPGNIRELQNVIERAVIMTSGETLNTPLNELELPDQRVVTARSTSATTLEECEREHILDALNETRWIIGGLHGAAARLGLKRTTLISKMQKLGITRKPEAA
jgi:formate hydrogenlyase transcriptional activator